MAPHLVVYCFPDGREYQTGEVSEEDDVVVKGGEQWAVASVGQDENGCFVVTLTVLDVDASSPPPAEAVVFGW